MTMLNKKEVAFKLRREGKSLGTIAKHLEVSKSSVSLWCKGMVLTKEQQKLLTVNQIKAGMKGRLLGAAINKKRKLETIEFYKKQSYFLKNLIKI